MAASACRINNLGQIVCTSGPGSGSDPELEALLQGRSVPAEKIAMIVEVVRVIVASNLPAAEYTSRTDDTASTVEQCLNTDGFPEAIFKDLNTARAYGSLKLAADENWNNLCRLLKGTGITC